MKPKILFRYLSIYPHWHHCGCRKCTRLDGILYHISCQILLLSCHWQCHIKHLSTPNLSSAMESIKKFLLHFSPFFHTHTHIKNAHHNRSWNEKRRRSKIILIKSESELGFFRAYDLLIQFGFIDWIFLLRPLSPLGSRGFMSLKINRYEFSTNVWSRANFSSQPWPFSVVGHMDDSMVATEWNTLNQSNHRWI